LETAPTELRLGQTENYVEYSRTGHVLKGKEHAKARSKYAEDVYINNHTSIWGSWYIPSARQWGYACCHSTIHLSYCAGQAGIEAHSASSAQRLLAAQSGGDEKEDDRFTAAQNTSKAAPSKAETKRKDRSGKEEEEEGSKRRKFNAGVTDEEMEEYKRTRITREDPMANYRDEEVY